MLPSSEYPALDPGVPPIELKRKLTSRKFISTVAAFVAGILSAVGVLDMTQAAEVGTLAAPLLYILVEGFVDARAV